MGTELDALRDSGIGGPELDDALAECAAALQANTPEAIGTAIAALAGFAQSEAGHPVQDALMPRFALLYARLLAVGLEGLGTADEGVAALARPLIAPVQEIAQETLRRYIASRPDAYAAATAAGTDAVIASARFDVQVFADLAELVPQFRLPAAQTDQWVRVLAGHLQTAIDRLIEAPAPTPRIEYERTVVATGAALRAWRATGEDAWLEYAQETLGRAIEASGAIVPEMLVPTSVFDGALSVEAAELGALRATLAAASGQVGDLEGWERERLMQRSLRDHITEVMVRSGVAAETIVAAEVRAGVLGAGGPTAPGAALGGLPTNAQGWVRATVAGIARAQGVYLSGGYGAPHQLSMTTIESVLARAYGDRFVTSLAASAVADEVVRRGHGTHGIVALHRPDGGTWMVAVTNAHGTACFIDYEHGGLVPLDAAGMHLNGEVGGTRYKLLVTHEPGRERSFVEEVAIGRAVEAGLAASTQRPTGRGDHFGA